MQKSSVLVLVICLTLVSGVIGCFTRNFTPPNGHELPPPNGHEVPDDLETPQLATPDGLYNMPFSAVIVNLKENERAFYTLDGAEPSLLSAPYTESGITLLDGENIIRAIKFGPDNRSSDILTAVITIENHEPDYSNLFTKITIVGDLIYYVQYIHGPYSQWTSFPPYTNLYCYNLTNGSRKVVIDRDIVKFIIKDNVIYFREYVTEAATKEDEDEEVFFLLSRIDLNGDNYQVIFKGTEDDFRYTDVMVDNWIFYYYRDLDDETDTWNLFRVNVDTFVSQQVSTGGAGYAKLFLDGKLIYTEQTPPSIASYCVDTSKVTQISSDYAWNFKYYGGFIYYFNDEVQKVYRIRPDGTDHQLVPGATTWAFTVAGDRIYHVRDSRIRSTRFDGANEKVNCNKDTNDITYYMGNLYFFESNNLFVFEIETEQLTKLLEGDGDLYFVNGEIYFICKSLYENKAGLYVKVDKGMQKISEEIK